MWAFPRYYLFQKQIRRISSNQIVYQHPTAMEDDGTFEVGSRYSEGISASLPFSPSTFPIRWRSWAMLHTAANREGERARGERCSVFPVPGRLSRLLPTEKRQREGEGGEVRWSLERTSERTRRRVSARSWSRGRGAEGEEGRALRRRRYHARRGRGVAEQRKITGGKVESILQISCPTLVYMPDHFMPNVRVQFVCCFSREVSMFRI